MMVLFWVGRFLLTASLRRRRVSMYSELQIPVDYTGVLISP